MKRTAFTLVELLTVIVIIAMLAALSMVALSGAAQTAKEMKTFATIQKIDAAIAEIYETYDEKFESIRPLKISATNSDNDIDNIIDTTGGIDLTGTAMVKRHLMWDLMRMEMPSNWKEVASTSVASVPVQVRRSGTPVSRSFQVDVPAVFWYYANLASKVTGNVGDSELLYLIIANLNPEALENFRGGEVGDLDDNGLMEFHDAWGNPIYFLRAAPAFTGSDKQPDFVGHVNERWKSSGKKVDRNNWGDAINDGKDIIQRLMDPLDPNLDAQSHSPSWFVYPLIYSAGPDKKDGINYFRIDEIDAAASDPPGRGDLIPPRRPEDINPFLHIRGLPTGNTHFDNIHNHRRGSGL